MLYVCVVKNYSYRNSRISNTNFSVVIQIDQYELNIMHLLGPIAGSYDSDRMR